MSAHVLSLSQNALTTLCRLLEKSVIYSAESKHKLECVRTKVRCAAVTCLLPCGMDLKTPSKAIHPIAFPQKGPRNYTTCQSYKQVNMMKEINASITVISNKISLAYSESLKGT